MVVKQTVLAPQELRRDAVCFLSSRFPQFSGLPEKIPDDLIAGFTKCLLESPSATFLDYCAHSSASFPYHVAVSRVRNLLSVLPESGDSGLDPEGTAGLRRRSVSVSLTVWVVADMDKNCLGKISYSDWDKGVRYWVSSAVKIAHELPSLFHFLSRQERLLNYIHLTKNLGRVEQLIDFCRERQSLEPSMVVAFLDNKAPALGDGNL